MNEDLKHISDQKLFRIYIGGFLAGIISLVLLFVILVWSSISEQESPTGPKIVGEDIGVTIMAPDVDTVILQGDRLSFDGFYYDRDRRSSVERDKIEEQMIWSSSIDGQFGIGREVSGYKYFSPGSHIITLSLINPEGVAVEASQELIVREHPVFTIGVEQYLAECEPENTLTCFNTVVALLAIWDREKAIEVIADNPKQRHLNSLYDAELAEYARVKKDHSLCGEIKNSLDREGCFVSLAVQTGSPTLCESAGSRVGNCYFWVAEKLQDIELCQKSENVDACLENMKDD